MRFRCGPIEVAVNLLFVFISSFFAMFKNVEHSLEPGETPSHSASHQAPNYVQRSLMSQNTLKRCIAVAFIFSIYLKPVLYMHHDSGYNCDPYRSFLQYQCAVLCSRLSLSTFIQLCKCLALRGLTVPLINGVIQNWRTLNRNPFTEVLQCWQTCYSVLRKFRDNL